MEICPITIVPKLKSADADRRLEWAKRLFQKLSLEEIDVKTITFSDEKRFLIDRPEMCLNYLVKDSFLHHSLSGQALDLIEQPLCT